MSCEDGYCGTGGSNLPKPGDPDNNMTLQAVPAFGGIDVTWTMPTTNEHAVALVEVYRGIQPDFLLSTRRVKISGDYFYDKVGPGVLYYYWIRTLSVNGTYGEVIGPASSYARDTISDTIIALTGKIDAGLLAQSLKGQIERIPEIDDLIFRETGSRLAGDQALSDSITEVRAITNETTTLVVEEIKQRRDADGALVQQINVVYAQANGNAAAITSEIQARTDADTALASRIDSVEAQVGDDLAAVQVKMQADIKTNADKITSIGSLYTAKLTVNKMIGGFGVYNDGTSVEAGFDVDTFWVGRTDADKKKPFIISNNQVFINDAVVEKLTFTKLRADDGSLIVEGGKVKANYIQARGLRVQADNGVVGLNIDTAGNVTFGGKIDVISAGAGQNRLSITNSLLQVYDSNNRLRVRLGVW